MSQPRVPSSAPLQQEQLANLQVSESPESWRPDSGRSQVLTCLNGGVAPAQVAEWAGHSVAVLLRVYAKCIDGHDTIAKRRIEEALGNHGEEPDEGNEEDSGDGPAKDR